MELHKLTADEIRSWDPERYQETKIEIRKALADIRMDIFSAKAQSSAKIVGYKRSIARMMTVQTEMAKAKQQKK